MSDKVQKDQTLERKKGRKKTQKDTHTDKRKQTAKRNEPHVIL